MCRARRYSAIARVCHPRTAPQVPGFVGHGDGFGSATLWQALPECPQVGSTFAKNSTFPAVKRFLELLPHALAPGPGRAQPERPRNDAVLGVGPVQCSVVAISSTLDRRLASCQLREVSHPGWIWSCRTSTTNLTLRSHGKKCC